MKLLNREEVKRIDRQVVQMGQPQAALIESVGAKLSQWLHPKIDKDHKVLVLMGPGNNGDDAAVVFRRLCRHNKNIDGLRLSEKPTPFIHSEAKLFGLKDLNRLPFHQYDWIIDGLFGTGLDRKLDTDISELVNRVNNSKAKRVAIDIPSGVDCDSGEVHGVAIQANHTLTIAAPKRGLYLLPGRDYCGEIHIIDVSALNQCVERQKIQAQALDNFNFSSLQPKRKSHKYSRGKVAVALSETFPGAGLMVAMAAQNAGAGYLQVYCPQKLLEKLQIQYPHLVFKPYRNKKQLWQALSEDDFQCLAIGSGWPENFPKHFPSQWTNKKIVMDGGFLTSTTLQKSKSYASHVILTPHAGELRRLLKGVTSNKWAEVEALIHQWQGVVVAKGYDSIIAQKNKPYALATWNIPSLATAGSGDILCGITAAMALQTDCSYQAACMAVDAHRRLAQNNPVAISPMTLLNRIESILNNHSDNKAPEST